MEGGGRRRCVIILREKRKSEIKQYSGQRSTFHPTAMIDASSLMTYLFSSISFYFALISKYTIKSLN